jgi:hypothetical protein
VAIPKASREHGRVTKGRGKGAADLDGDDGAVVLKGIAEHVLVGLVGQATDVDRGRLVHRHLAATGDAGPLGFWVSVPSLSLSLALWLAREWTTTGLGWGARRRVVGSDLVCGVDG